MEGAPEIIDTEQMLLDIKKLPNVTAVHDFHCWSLSRGKYAMSAHIVVTQDTQGILKESIEIVKNYGIDHSTIQMEDDESCQQKC